MFLTRKQIQQLTGKKRCSAQIRALRSMSIDHIVRPDGKPVVTENAIMQPENQAKTGHVQLNLNAI